MAAIQPLKKSPKPTIKSPITLAFTLVGQHDDFIDKNGDVSQDGFPSLYDIESKGVRTLAEDRPIAYAKKVITNTRTRCFVKRNSLGRLYNPLGMYEELKHNKQLKGTSQDGWKYHEVSSEVFDSYLTFLKSRNVAWLLNAERQTI